MQPEFMSDALDDLRADADERKPVPPIVHDVPAGFVSMVVANGTVMHADQDFLRAVAPELWLLRGCMSGVAHDHARGSAYASTSDSARGARHRGYQEGIR